MPQKRNLRSATEQRHSAVARGRDRSGHGRGFLPDCTLFFTALICALGIIRHRGHLAWPHHGQKSEPYRVSPPGTHRIAVSTLISALSPSPNFFRRDITSLLSRFIFAFSHLSLFLPLFFHFPLLFLFRHRFTACLTCINELKAWVSLPYLLWFVVVYDVFHITIEYISAVWSVRFFRVER